MNDDRKIKIDRQERFSLEIEHKAKRKIRARREKDRDVMDWLGMFGIVGWSVAIPTLIGIALGVWLDKRFPGRISWTLTLLFIGVILGCINAWFWVKKESNK